MKKRQTRLKATNEKSIKGNCSLCGDSFEIDIEEEFNFEDEEFENSDNNFNLIL